MASEKKRAVILKTTSISVPSPINKLPFDVIRVIFTHLDLATLSCLWFVSSYLRSITSNYFHRCDSLVIQFGARFPYGKSLLESLLTMPSRLKRLEVTEKECHLEAGDIVMGDCIALQILKCIRKNSNTLHTICIRKFVPYSGLMTLTDEWTGLVLSASKFVLIFFYYVVVVGCWILICGLI